VGGGWLKWVILPHVERKVRKKYIKLTILTGMLKMSLVDVLWHFRLHYIKLKNNEKSSEILFIKPPEPTPQIQPKLKLIFVPSPLWLEQGNYC
jgi:hypothetical protein